MGYIRAQEVLPEEVLSLVRQFVEGKAIYIPKKEKARRPWGTDTETKAQLQKRNEQIWEKRRQGVSEKELADAYFLTRKSIQRILRKMKENENET